MIEDQAPLGYDKGLDYDRGHAVGDDVLQDDAQVRAAHGPRGLDELHVADGEHGAAHDTSCSPMVSLAPPLRTHSSISSFLNFQRRPILCASMAFSLTHL